MVPFAVQKLSSLIRSHLLVFTFISFAVGFPGGSDGNDSSCNAGNLGFIPGSGRSPGEGNGHPLQYSCLGNPWTEEPGGLQSMELQKESDMIR